MDEEEIYETAAEAEDEKESKAEARVPTTTDSTEHIIIPEQAMMPAFVYNQDKSVDENATELMELAASREALLDQDFVEKVAGVKKAQLEESAKANKDIHMAKKEAERVTALTEVDMAFYEQWKAVFTFGGMNEPTSKKFATFMLCILVPFYILITLFITMPISVVKYLLSAINALLDQVAKFGKAGRSIAITLLIIGAIALAGWLGYSLVSYFLGTLGADPIGSAIDSIVNGDISSSIPVIDSAASSSDVLDSIVSSSDIIESIESSTGLIESVSTSSDIISGGVELLRNIATTITLF